MNQWEDDLLVAIQSITPDRFKVLELPPRQSTFIVSRRTFTTYEQAESYIDKQYPTALSVQNDDLQDEAKRRYVKELEGSREQEV